ncbi:DUF6083 domain-containing protein [Streptomyces sp. NPDC085866]|uniref:DUF6083 domain-containing protein n=1 Tax=Streptomyces sp. NPDC085866 TaxID=3365736 RepID=UPI0037D1A635
MPKHHLNKGFRGHLEVAHRTGPFGFAKRTFHGIPSVFAFPKTPIGRPDSCSVCRQQRVPAEHRWIELSDGRVTVYGVCPPDQFQRCRIEHRLACPAQPLPDLWPWLTALRGENARQAERDEPEPPPPPEQWPDAG